MSVHGNRQPKRVQLRVQQIRFRLRPLCQAIALAMMTGAAHAAPLINLGHVRTATGSATTLGVQVPGMSNLGVQQPQVAQQTVLNLGHVAAAVAAQVAAQQAAAAAAVSTASTVPNGLAAGGLQVLPGGTWTNANAPTQAVANGHTTVTVQQTAPQALLDWNTFNIGRQTTLDFNQQGNANWVAMNRVLGASTAPSQILGSIQATGQVYVIDQNGIIFGAGSQINTGALVASTASLDPTQFTANGIYSTQSGSVYNPSFTNAGGAILVEPGAQISTNAPSSVTAGGGYVLLMGTSVSNQGSIATPDGQTALVAGDNFLIRPGYSTAGNSSSTTDGNEIAVQLNPNSSSGSVSNTGIIQATTGDITMVGHAVTQGGVAIATTSISTRGTIHLLNSAADSTGSVTLTTDSVTAITPDTGGATALSSQQQALISDSATQDANRIAAANAQFDDLSLLADLEDESRVEIVSGGTAQFQGGSLTMAQGGQIAVSAAQRVQVDSGANLDVSGTDAVLPMSANALAVSIEGGELADAPVNRDTNDLNSDNVTVDTQDLQYVAAGTGGYASARYYTEGGLLEVSGELGNVGQTIDQWLAPGGTITLSTGAAGAVVAQTGSTFNLSGGAIQYQAGNLAQSWLQGADGHIYNVNTAPASIEYMGVYNGFVESHPAWGVTKDWLNPLIAPSQIYEAGYTVGKNAGSLVLNTPTAVFEGNVVAGVMAGAQQTVAPITDGVDADMLAQNVMPEPGSLELGDYTAAGLTSLYATSVTFGSVDTGNADSLLATDAIPAALENTAYFDANQLSGYGLGALSVTTAGTIEIQAPLMLASGAQLNLVAPVVDIAANITDHSGNVSITNILGLGESAPTALQTAAGLAQETLEAGVTLDTSGVWTNALLDPGNLSGLPFVNGGGVWLDSTQGVTLSAASTIDTSSGGAVLPGGKTQGGKGGNITLIADDPSSAGTAGSAPLILDGTLTGIGVTSGGALTIQTGQGVVISGQPVLPGNTLPAGQAAPVQLALAQPLVVSSGAASPLTFSQTISTDGPGQSLSVAVDPTWANGGLTVSANWTVPSTISYVYDSNFNFYSPGQVVSPGTLLIGGSGNLPAGYVVPTNVFPSGIPIAPVTFSAQAGVAVAQPVTIPAGTVVPSGTVLAQDVAVRPLLNLPPTFFAQGFSNYNVTGEGGVTVTPGTQVNVVEPVYEFTGASQAAPSGSNPSTALTVWTPPLYVPNPLTASLTSRAGASLSLSGGSLAVTGPVTVGEGALLAVDPSQSIGIDSVDQITVDGTLRAPGGAISIIGAGGPNYSAAGQSIWIGGDAVLDAAANAATALDQYGRTYGVVPDGGSITLGAAGDVLNGAGIIDSAYDFIVVRPGAVLDASGASALINLNAGASPTPFGASSPSGSVLVASNGGSITLSSYNGIYAEGILRAAAGGPGAAGGALNVTLETPNDFSIYDPTDPSFTPRVITISQAPLAPQLPADLQPGASDPGMLYGQAQFSAATLAAGGFGALSFTGRDAILFNGNVNLTAGQSVAFHEGAIADTSTGGQVTITAPYVLLDGFTGIHTNVISVYPTLWDGSLWSPSTQQSTGVFNINADLIDISNDVVFGIDSPASKTSPGSINAIGTATAYDYAGFANVNLTSQGDIRFLGGVNSPGLGPLRSDPGAALITSGDLTFTAAQLYPVMSSSIVNGAVQATFASVIAGAQAQGAVDPDSVITINRISDADPGMPDSIAGQIVFSAATINQGGVVRAPFGSIEFLATNAINLLPGSITSSSMDGLTMLVGGTVDGITWAYDGVTFNGDANLSGTAIFSGNNVTLNSPSFNVAAGAVIDVSGGGDIAGAGFISGEGGSVNILTTPLVNANPANSYSAAGDQVYAIVPGYQSSYAPVDPAAGAAPGIGQQVAIPSGVPGLPAGTYTLLPANYALLPGGYRVELGGTVARPVQGAVAASNGVYLVEGYQSVADTGVRNALPTELILMPGGAVRDNSDFDETDYSQYEIQLAASVENIRPALPIDGGTLAFEFNGTPSSGQSPLTFDGAVLFAPGTDAQSGVTGQPGQADIYPGSANVEVYAGSPTPGFSGVSLNVDDLNNIAAPSLTIGGGPNNNGSIGVTIDSGVVLKAAQVLLVSGPGGAITLQPSAEIDTIGMGAAPVALSGNNALTAVNDAILAVSNSGVTLNYLGGSASTINVEDGAQLYSEGSIGFAAGGPVTIADGAVFGTANLGFSAADINIGSAAASAAANVPAGFNLTSDVLSTLLAGDPSVGAPALQTLTLTASQSFNVFGSVDLGIIDPATGKADLNLVLNTPAIYGYGSASDAATLTVGTLTWSGVAGATPGPITTNGPGTGAGTLNIVANQIAFGFPSNVAPDTQTTYDRAIYGFSTVNLSAPEITSTNKNTLSVYQSVPTVEGVSPSGAGVGGDLNLETSLLTGGAGSLMGFTAGGALTIAPPSGAAPTASGMGALGAEIDLTAGGGINVASTVLLPSGLLTMTTAGDINLQPGSNLDLAGQPVTLVDQTEYSWGGNVVLVSTGGNIIQAAGSTINVSAVDNDAGLITAQAIGSGAGQVALNGALEGAATSTPGVTANFNGGSIGLSAQTLASGDAANLSADFAALNTMLDASGFSYSRTFDLKQGDLTIGNEVVARQVNVSVDNGSLSVNGTIDASGITPGSINLAALNNLTLNGTLDAHGTALQVDSYGNPIAAENEGIVNLTAASGLLTLANGSTIDVSVTSPQGQLLASQGDVELNAPRTGSGAASATGANAPANATGTSVNILAAGPITIKGAASIAVNAFATYTNALADPNDANGQIIDQTYLDEINTDSQAFMAAADANPALQSNLAGLIVHGSTFHLRPGIEIASATPNGDLSVQGDLDLSGYRYADPAGYGEQVNSAVYGSGEPGVLVLRAGGNLNVDGSVTDGFGPPPGTPDDNGWILMSAGKVSSNTTLSQSATIGAGSTFAAGSLLSFPLQIVSGSGSLAANTPASNGTALIDSYTIPAGTVLNEALSVPNVLPAGTATSTTINIVSSPALQSDDITAAAWVIPATISDVLAFPPGSTSGAVYRPGATLPAGSTLREIVFVSSTTIPANVFPNGVTTGETSFAAGTALTSAVTLPAGFTLPAGLTLPGTVSVANVLPADTTATFGTVLATSYTIPAGTVLNEALSVPDVLPAGTATSTTINIVSSPALQSDDITAAAWVIPATISDVLAFPPGSTSGAVYRPGATLPAGSTLREIVFVSSTTIPANVFPNGVTTGETSFAAGTALTSAVTLPAGTTLPTGLGLPGNALTVIVPMQLAAGTTIPTGVINTSSGAAGYVTLASSATLTQALNVTATITLPNGTVYVSGTTLPSGTVLPAGSEISAGQTLNFATQIDSVTWPANVALSFTTPITLATNSIADQGSILAAGSDILGVNGAAVISASGHQLWAIAPMLAAGDLSWSMQIVAGADPGAADTAILQPGAQLNGGGNLTLDDPHVGAANPGGLSGDAQSFSVIRTGTGSLSLLAGGDFNEESPFGIYTAGAQSGGIGPNGSDPYNLPRGLNSDGSGTVLGSGNAAYEAAIQDYSAYYPTNGGNLLVSVQGNLSAIASNNGVGNWLWTQGGAVAGQAAAWWINFGTYADVSTGSGPYIALVGFNGFGALGGGNVMLNVGGNANGVTAAVGSAGRVLANGTLAQTGGGNLFVNVGGALGADASHNGSLFTDLRGDTVVNAGSIGAVAPAYGSAYGYSSSGQGINDPRYIGPLVADSAQVSGGLTVDPGDGSVTISTRGDLVLADAANPGVASQPNTTPFTNDGAGFTGGGDGWFSLWTNATAVNLFSAGGNLAPSTFQGQSEPGPSYGLYIYPSSLNAVAASGSIYFPAMTTALQQPVLELAPAPDGQLNLLAEGSIIGGAVAMSGADPAVIPTPFDPAFDYEFTTITNLSPNTYGYGTSGNAFFAFGPDTPTTDLHANDPDPIRIYAATGDIVGFNLGEVLTFEPSTNPNIPSITPSTWYIGAKAADIIAGGDIVIADQNPAGGNVTPGFILNDSPTDVSLISAGRDIIYTSMEIGGPGLLEVQAGGNYYAGNEASLTSIGPVFDIDPYDLGGGAGITVLAGVGANGPDYSAFANLYLNPANQANAAYPDTDPVNAGKVPMTYQDQLYAWLQQRYGYSGDAADAYAYFEALPTVQQSVFLLEVYFDELNASGLEFNDPASKRYKSYLRGKDAIAALFPNVGPNDPANADTGDITLFGPSGIHTEFGGAIQTLTPGGQTLVGVNGANPPGTAGVITQGSGDIDMYSDDSISLGQSRVMTTFGGNIVMWSATGNIDAGLGSKTTVVYTPARRVYDNYGNVALAPTVPSNGAGIAALNPIPGVPPADVNLVAPQGIVDAGEAGIRVSGNLNVAALRVENASNIQVQGKTTGIPMVAAVNTGALTTADAAAAAVTQIAQNLVKSNAQGVTQRHWIITVEVEGFGDDSGDRPAKKRKPQSASSADPQSPFQVIGYGAPNGAQLKRLRELGLSNAEQLKVSSDH